MCGLDFSMCKMTWTLSICVAAAVMALCRGGDAANEGINLSPSGYHVCIHNVSQTVPYLALHTVSHTLTKSCGGWLPLRICTVTLYKVVQKAENRNMTRQVLGCCDGYVQVGRYCALPLNSSDDVTAKPGSCPTTDGSHPSSQTCQRDIDCQGWQKCCQTSDRRLCSHPARSASYSVNGGHRFNATVTVKTDYEELMSTDGGHLNHTRLLQAMLTGALESDVWLYFLASWPVHPYRTATSLLIDSQLPLSLNNITSKLHLLLKHIQEVSSVTVDDVDECRHSALRHCSIVATCNNTIGSYRCACILPYMDLDPSNPGAHCTANVSSSITSLPPMNTTHPPASNSTQNPQDRSTPGPGTATKTSMTMVLTHSSWVSSNSSQTQQWMPPTSVSPTLESPPPTTACSPSSISSLWSANVTGTSFVVFWSSRSPTNQTYQVFVRQGSKDICCGEINQTSMEVSGLQPGILYNVTVTPVACGNRGITLHASVQTDAQTLEATTRLTNIQFTADLQNSSSPAYMNLTESIRKEIYQSLSSEMKALVDSNQVRIEIRGFYPGSVVVNFTVVFTPSQSQNISNVSTALLSSLMNSSKYAVDQNNTNINDFDECSSGENDCSQWATCSNTWASYTCVCLDGFIDINPERPGRACTVAPTTPPTILPTVNTTPFSHLTTPTNNPALVTTTTTPGRSTVISTTTVTSVSTTSSVSQTAVPVLTATYTTPITISAPTANTIVPTAATTAVPATTTTVPTTNTTDTLTTSSATNNQTTIAITSTTTSILATTTTATKTTPTVLTITSTNSTAIVATSTTTTAPTTPNTLPTMVITGLTTKSSVPATTNTYQTTLGTTSTPTTVRTNTIIASTKASTVLTATSTVPTTPNTAPTKAITAMSTNSNVHATTTTYQSTLANTSTPTIVPNTTIIASTKASTALKTTSTVPATTITSSTTPTSLTTIAATPTTSTTPTAIVPTITIPTPTNNATSPRTVTNASIPGAISVQCHVASITVTVARDFLLHAKIRESSLYLGLQECGVNGGNATHARLTVAWNECATSLVNNETHYMACVTLFNSMGQYISPNGTLEVPGIKLEVPIVCGYLKSILISSDFSSMGYDMIKDVIMGSGWFQVTVQLMNGTMPLPQNYTLPPGESVVVDVSLNTSSQQIKLVINKCWATPTQNPTDTYGYIFLENSCSLNVYTEVLTNGNSSVSRLSVQIFSFVKLKVIFLHCQVQICAQMGSETCIPDCLQRTARSSNTVGTAFGSSGPLLMSEEEPLEEYHLLHVIGISCLGVCLSICFIAGFVLLFYYQRNRIGHYNFNTKPKKDNFSYLHFNT